MTSSRLSPRVLASYSGLGMPMAAMGMPIAVYLPQFYAEGMGLEDAIPLANRSASIAVTRRGAQPSLPRRSELD